MIHRLTCFGIPSVFSFKSLHCGRCQSFEECRKSANEELKSVAADSDVVRFALIEHERAEYDASAPANRVDPVSSTKAKRRSYVPKRPKYDLTQAQKHTVSTAPKTAATRLTKLFRTGGDVLIRRALKNGDRDFAEVTNQRSLALCLRMLSHKLPVTRNGLKVAFMTELGWADSSAQSEATIMWNVLRGLGVTYRNDNALVLAPKFIADNNQTRNEDK